MNERIEKETIRIWLNDGYEEIFHRDAYYFACLQNIAEHFYNLALEDMKKKLEARMPNLKPHQGQGIILTKMLKEQCQELIDHIDNLSK